MAVMGERLHEVKATMDRLADQTELPAGASPEFRQLVTDALHSFTTSGPDLVDQATPFLWEYYRSVADEFPPARRAEYAIPEM